MQRLHLGTLGKPHGIKGALSVYSKTEPSNLLQTQSLYLEDGTPFEISKWEDHHAKSILYSPKIPDRSEAERWKGVRLYCDRDAFFDQHPDQILKDLCQGYTVLDLNNKTVGILDEITYMQEIPMLIVHHESQILHLGLKSASVDHQNQTLTLEYTYDH